MIDKVVVTLGDEGEFIVNAGEVQIVIAHSLSEVAYLVSEFSKKLACFPQSIHSGQANPITFDEFQKRKKSEKKK
jgi:hypothetical protein